MIIVKFKLEVCNTIIFYETRIKCNIWSLDLSSLTFTSLICGFEGWYSLFIISPLLQASNLSRAIWQNSFYPARTAFCCSPLNKSDIGVQPTVQESTAYGASRATARLIRNIFFMLHDLC